MKSVLSAHSGHRDSTENTMLFSWDTEPEHGKLTFDCTPSAAGILVVRISGDIDVTTVPLFGSHLDEAVNERRPFVLDLSHVQFFCASALSVLEIIAGRARRLGLPWAVTGNTAVRRPLTAMKMDAVVPYSTSLDEACRLVAEGLPTHGISA
ncbi:STAS domain-containing protein [Rhodococcus tibetensis]|uniref:STAS domain-containing protein n=1 Tax=Rhodococcus tibetensis TaxID=2965064 RepID=A0ABT1Q863_9NOCA|nr:STAS domain-containing protein [Rhodococcus sp. FXJ9.536]MCQ4118444.1 STAS domain-containing protein [Rhodococcus sp. FXJ9.536]